METKHTPGPWKVGTWAGQCKKPSHTGKHPGPRGEDPCVYEPVFVSGVNGIAAENGMCVVAVSYDELVISEPDARLIAAAPELLAVLIELIDLEGPLPGNSAWHAKAIHAIAKATGEA